MTNALNASSVAQGLSMPSLSASSGPTASSSPGMINRGLCTLSYRGRTLTFRTNPNEIWWDYQLITNIDQTYGGRVIQLLGTRLGDLSVTVECGQGGWPYLMQVVSWLRDLLVDQRSGNTAEFEYTTRNWHLKVYALNIPFQDEVEATTRPLVLNFKIQEDVSGVLSQVSLNTELARLQEGVYGPGQMPHNRFNDYAFDREQNDGSLNASGPAYAPSGVTNTVDSTPQGEWLAGGIANPVGLLPSIPGLGSLAGLGNLNLGSIPGLSYIPGLGSIPGL